MREQGHSLAEVLIASVIMAVLAGGMMLSFLAAVRVSQRASTSIEESSYAQQTLERYRNMIACGAEWFDASCKAKVSGLPESAADPLPAGALYGGSREYTVTREDCDGVGGPGDCLKVVAQVTWEAPL